MKRVVGALAAWALGLGPASCGQADGPAASAAVSKAPRAETRVTLNSALAAQVGAASVASTAARCLGLSGRGTRVGVWDENHARASHVDLQGRVLAHDPGGIGLHATHTTATLAGAGAGDPEARGLAPEARVWAFDWHLDLPEVEAFAAALGVASHAYGPTLGWAVEPGCADHPTFWGAAGQRRDAAFGRYGALSADVDGIARRTDLLMVWPAGNERLDRGAVAGEPHYHAGSCERLYTDAHLSEHTLQYGTLGGAATAKNALTVGAVRALAPADLSPERIAALDTSSFGPTQDGRLKPELCAGGEGVWSAGAAHDRDYAPADGSSSASAAVAGAAALLSELYRRERAGADMRAAQLRALLVHTARDAGAKGPDFATGFGLLDVAAAAEVIEADSASTGGFLTLAVVEPNAALEFESEAVAAGMPLRVTAAWTDPPGPSSAELPALVNDIDLELRAPDQPERVLFPWTLDAAEPSAPARRTQPNRVDNLEVVDVDAADNTAAGAWQVRLMAHGALVRDARQVVALVSSVALRPKLEPASRLLAAPRYVDVEFSLGESPAPVRVSLGASAGGLAFRARSLDPWIAVAPAEGAAPAELTLALDAAALARAGEHFGRVVIDSDDPQGPRTLGVVARVRCEPACDGLACGRDPVCGASCGRCAADESCRAGRCTALVNSCPQGDLGAQLGEEIASAVHSDARSAAWGTCGGDGPELAWSWQAPESGSYVVSTYGSQRDTVLYARTLDCGGPELACNDDAYGTASAIGLELAAGERVVLVVDGFDARSRGRSTLNIARAQCPSLQLGARLGVALVRASTFGSVDALHASCGGQGSPDASFGWTAPAQGRYRFALHHPGAAGILSVRSGDCDGPELGCSVAAETGAIEVELQAEQAVVVVVDGRGGGGGDFTLEITDAARGCGSTCGGAGAEGACFCDAACVAAGDCCADACEACGHCSCEPRCDGLACGEDGCGGRCGECALGQACEQGRCVPDLCAAVVCGPCSECRAGRCLALPQGAACEDGDPCTVADVCEQGACSGRALRCDDGIECTRDRCDPLSGACAFEPQAGCVRDRLACADAGPCAPPCVAAAGDADRVDADAGSSEPRRAASGCGCRLAAAGAAQRAWPFVLLWLLALRRVRARRTVG